MVENEKKELNHFMIARLVAAASLMLATASLPYRYYTLMRWLVCIVAGYGAVRSNEQGARGWTWVFGGVAVIFNPIAPLGFNRADWAVIDA